jgi:ubiquinone/menaquinone biosynthesis C-methylase UbiE
MSTGLSFDSEMASGLEEQYRRPAMVLRRARALEHAAPQLGGSVVDVGSGPGFLTADLALGVGREGAVVGVDQSEAMVELARARCRGLPQARIDHGDATALPLDDGSCDLVVSTQVLAYVAEVDRALDEMGRVLRPGGRVVLLATDWRSVAWHSSDDARMSRVLSAWEEHLAHPALPRTLASRLEKRGTRVTEIDRYSIIERAEDRLGYSAMLVGGIASFVPGHRGVTQEEARAWAEDLECLRERGETHYSVGQYFFCAEKV